LYPASFGSVTLKLRIEMLQFLLGADREPALQHLECDAFVGRPERDDLVDVLGGFPAVFGIRPLHRLPHDEPAHGMSDDVHLRNALRLVAGIDLWLVPGERADEVDEADQHLTIDREVPIVEVVVTEHPEHLERIAARSQELQRYPRIDNDFVPREELWVEA
jgi:hypothetical protein